MSGNRQSSDLDVALEVLRGALSEGQVRNAEAVGQRIGEMLAAGDASPHAEALQLVLDGVVAVLAGEHRTALSVLHKVTADDRAPVPPSFPSLQWGAWLWTCRASLGLGNLETASHAAEETLELSAALDDAARGISLCAMAEVAGVSGDADTAMEHLSTAADLAKQRGDPRGQAVARLAQARVQARAGHKAEAVAAARQAQELAPDWGAPLLFLATQGLKECNLGRAKDHLNELDQLGPRTQEATRLRGLISLVTDEEIPLWVVTEYLRLREALPSTEVVNEIKALLLYSPRLYHLREELAWKLIKLGRHDEAIEQLETLQERPLDPAVKASVLLGLSSVASMRQESRPPGARVRAAVATTGVATDTEQAPEPEKPRPHGQAGPQERWVYQAVESIAGEKGIFSGDLGILSLSDLLEFLRNGKRTGTLVLQSAKGPGAIYVRSGLITNASSPNCHNIGDLLLDCGAIQPEQLHEIATRQRDDDRGSLMGALFVERNMVSAETMEQVLREQLFSAVRELFQWTSGQFAFLPDRSPRARSPSIEIELEPRHVLLEVARAIDEEGRN